MAELSASRSSWYESSQKLRLGDTYHFHYFFLIIVVVASLVEKWSSRGWMLIRTLESCGTKTMMSGPFVCRYVWEG